MSEILLNKFEKEKRVIEMHLEGKTIREMPKNSACHLPLYQI